MLLNAHLIYYVYFMVLFGTKWAWKKINTAAQVHLMCGKLTYPSEAINQQTCRGLWAFPAELHTRLSHQADRVLNSSISLLLAWHSLTCNSTINIKQIKMLCLCDFQFHGGGRLKQRRFSTLPATMITECRLKSKPPLMACWNVLPCSTSQWSWLPERFWSYCGRKVKQGPW